MVYIIQSKNTSSCDVSRVNSLYLVYGASFKLKA